jgi:hypothetical protein
VALFTFMTNCFIMFLGSRFWVLGSRFWVLGSGFSAAAGGFNAQALAGGDKPRPYRTPVNRNRSDSVILFRDSEVRYSIVDTAESFDPELTTEGLVAGCGSAVRFYCSFIRALPLA